MTSVEVIEDLRKLHAKSGLDFPTDPPPSSSPVLGGPMWLTFLVVVVIVVVACVVKTTFFTKKGILIFNLIANHSSDCFTGRSVSTSSSSSGEWCGLERSGFKCLAQEHLNTQLGGRAGSTHNQKVAGSIPGFLLAEC